jgi:hypothetical protein
MNTSENMGSVEQATIAPLATIVERNQVWCRMAAKYGVVNPVPPWKTSHDEEDALSATVYSDLPYPENRLVALAHSLLVRGVIDEAELKERLAAVRARLES